MTRANKINWLSIMIASRECTVCASIEERIFTDSWSGKDLCLACLGTIWQDLTNSPASEGDNLNELIKAHLDDEWEEVDEPV